MEFQQILKPRAISIIAEDTCMFKCKMCYQWKIDKNHDEITIKEWKSFVSSFRQFADDECQISFSGGELFIRKGILDLIYFANKIGYRTAVVTNAYLIDEEMAKRIAESGLEDIGISLDSLNEETHDFLRGVKGSYKRVMRAIEYLKRFSPNPKISIQAIILGKNLNELPELVEWVQGNSAIVGINFQAVVQPLNLPHDNLWYKKDDGTLWPKDLNKVYQVLNHLVELKNKGYKIGNSIFQLKAFEAYFENPDSAIRSCNISHSSFEVDNNGNLRICPLENIGNIRYENIANIWHPDRIALTEKRMANCKKICHFRINCFFEEANI